MKPKLLYYDILNYRYRTKNIMHDLFDVISLPDPRYDSSEVLETIELLLAPLGFKCDKKKIDLCPNLKVIGSNTTGEPHIDRKYAENRGIVVCSLMNDYEFLESITPTAEHTIGLILAITRRLPWAFQSVLSGTWNRRLFGGKQMLSIQSIGIIGLGRLGSKVAQYAEAFGMKILFYDPYVLEKRTNSKWERCITLESLVSQADIITLHVPANDETRSLLSDSIIDKFKIGSFFINTARAECVDELALLKALRTGKIAGAAIDVLNGEFNPDFNPTDHPLVKYAMETQNLIITPHIGGSTEDAWELTEIRILKKMYNSINK